MDNIPPAVVENIRNKETVLFIGSGFSLAAGLPSAAAIAVHLMGKLAADGKFDSQPNSTPLDKMAELFEMTYGRGRLTVEVASFLGTMRRTEISASHRLLASLVKHGFIKTIVTTNYDTLIEDACAALDVPISVVAHESQLHAAAGDIPVLYKIHGDFAHPELLVLTPADLQRWNRAETRPIVAQLQALLDKNALLFLGYSLSDFNILALLLGSDFTTRGAPRHKRFAAIYSKKELADTAERLRQYGVDTFPCDDTADLLRSVLLRLPLKLKIKHVVFNDPSWYPDQQAQYGGIETFIQYLNKYADDCTHEIVSVYSQGMLNYTPSRLAYTSSPIYPASFFFFRAAAKTALDQIQHALPDVVHIHFLAFAPLYEQAGIPTLCTSHSLLSLDLAYTLGLFDGIATAGGRQEVLAAYEAERAAASSVRFITVLSTAHEQEVRGIGARSVLRVEAPFDPHKFQVEEDPSSARERAWLDDRFTITYIGRPDRRKGIEILLRACETLAKRAKNLQLLLVGYGLRRSRGKLAFGSGRYSFDISALEASGVEIQLRYASDSTGASVFYSASDIIVVPSLYEPMGYVVLEAMACGRPIVASRVGGIVEIIRDGHTGMFFEPGNADELAEKLGTLYDDAALRKRLGQQARQDIEQRRPVVEVVRDWQALYRKAAFAFDEPLYPDPERLQTIRKKCETTKELENASDLYDLAVLGCRLVQETLAEMGKQGDLPAGIPIDRALINAVALELKRARLRKGLTASFSTAALAEIMADLSLADLNREPDKINSLQIDAEGTKNKLSAGWFQKALGFPTQE